MTFSSSEKMCRVDYTYVISECEVSAVGGLVVSRMENLVKL